MQYPLRVVWFAALFAVAAGCGKSRPAPMLDAIYEDEAQAKVVETRPVIVLPGILGSQLRDRETDTTVWGAFSGDYANPGRRDGARLIALPMAKGRSLEALHDDVVPDGVLDRLEIRVLGLPIHVAAYVDILKTLGVAGYIDEDIHYAAEHFTCFQFDYDWRRDNAETAALLYGRLLELRDYTHERLVETRGAENVPAKEEIKFDVVAHSMGGLVARYMLRYGDQPLPEDGSLPELTWKGAELVDRLIVVGTPNAGSAEAFRQLVEGKDFGEGKLAFWLPVAPASVLGSMPSIYQLLPRVRHAHVVDAAGEPVPLYDADWWIDREIGLADPEQLDELGWLLGDDVPEAQRREVAIDHLRKCLARAEQFHAAIDLPAERPASLRVHLFAGDAVETVDELAIDDRNRIHVTRRAAGDGTVLRSSALMDERLALPMPARVERPLVSPLDWTSVIFLFQNHVGITRSPEFKDNVLFLLLEAP